MSQAHVRNVFLGLVREIKDVLPNFAARLRFGHAAEFPRARNFAYCLNERPPVVVVAPKLADQDDARIIALLAHELGHALIFGAGNDTHPERSADIVAEEMFGIRISYDAQDVQTIGPGARPRPAHLPK